MYQADASGLFKVESLTTWGHILDAIMSRAYEQVGDDHAPGRWQERDAAPALSDLHGMAAAMWASSPPPPIMARPASGNSLAAAPQKIQDLWNEITPMARWEWVRWVNATKNPDTRGRRVDVSISKMKSGKRRPCCFNLSACTDPDLSKNGRLLGLGDDRP